jgi:hypothetical protein
VRLGHWTRRLGTLDPDLDDPARIDLIRALEELKCAAEAAQAVVTADFDASQRAGQAARGVPIERQGRGVAAQVALARRESPHRGQQHVGLAKILPSELPHTRVAFRGGRISEWKAISPPASSPAPPAPGCAASTPPRDRPPRRHGLPRPAGARQAEPADPAPRPALPHPWCDAPIRPADHVQSIAEGGKTSETNGQGLCEACNYAKQAPGWRARPSPGPRHHVETTTPTGHRYTSTAPPLVRPRFVETHPGVWTLVA